MPPRVLAQTAGAKTKIVNMYCTTSKLNSTFRTIGKATADKMTAKVVGKLKLSLLRKELKSMLSCSDARLGNFEHF